MKNVLKGIIIFFVYAIILTACSDDGGGGGESTSMPSAPSNISATAGDEQVTIAWDPVAGADSYNIYWKSSSGVTTSDNKIEGAISMYMHSGLTNGYTYYYAVTAINSAGESGLSSEVSAKPKIPAGRFTKIITTGGLSGCSDIGAPDQARYMMLYPAEDIKASGIINSISLRYCDNVPSDVICPNVTIKMGHTNVTDLNDTFADNVEQGQGSFQTVVNNADITVPAGLANDYFSVTLSQPFNYNGVDNLVVEVTRSVASSEAIPVMYHEASYNGLNFNVDDISDSTGDVWPVLIDAKFGFAGGDDALIYGGNTGNSYPFNTDPNRIKVQLLYTNNEINGSGYITGIGFPISQSTGSIERAYTVNIRLGHTTLTDLVKSSWDANFNSGPPVTVASALTFEVPAGVPEGGYVWLPITNTFNYSGTDNLIVEIEVSGATTSTQWRFNSIGGHMTRLYGGSSSPLDENGNPDSCKYDIKFRFAGGTLDFITADYNSSLYPFRSDPNKIQFLYRAAELGTKGTIAKIACHLYDDSVAASYSNFTVALGHSKNSELGTMFSANMTDAQTVYSGTFSIPAGLKAGDWIEIPLSTLFVYDPTKNLVVQMSSQIGSSANGILAGWDDELFLNRRAFADDNTGDIAIDTTHDLSDLRLVIE